MNRFALFALALALPLAACADPEPDGDEVVTADGTVIDDAADDMDMADDTMTDDAMVGDAPAVTAQGTVDAVTAAGGLTALAPAAAIDNIDGWIAQLDGNPDFAPVVADLNTLKDQLRMDPLDGSAIGQTLLSLGAATTGAAAGDTALETLGNALTEAGNTLAGN